MKVGYARGENSSEQTQSELATFERLGCERIVVDDGAVAKRGAALDGLLRRLNEGDTLVVSSLGALASSMTELVNLTLELEARGVRIQSLAEEFDTQAECRQALIAMLRQLQLFQENVARHKALAARRSPGRPKALSKQEVERARAAIAAGQTIGKVAHDLRVSRATLYRYLNSQD